MIVMDNHIPIDHRQSALCVPVHWQTFKRYHTLFSPVLPLEKIPTLFLA